jgi:3-oxoacyl-[acyl-carrier-protein] synthase-3
LKISGFSASVPKQTAENADFHLFDSEAYKNFVATTGIERRRVSLPDLCTSDLCLQAAETLIADLQWQKSEIDALVFVTQTPDYHLPATSCLLQDKLGLSRHCYTLDISLGCSGWVYGLSALAALLQTGQMRRGLLLTGDTISKVCNPRDKSACPLFGDAGTATAVEFSDGAGGFRFHTETDGSGCRTIIIPEGGFRRQVSAASFEEKEISEGITRSGVNLALDGMDVFAFGIKRAPESVNLLLEHFAIGKESIDYFVFHQANRFMNEQIRKKLKLPEEKVPYSLKNFGNTSSASIPLTITMLKNVNGGGILLLVVLA